MPDPRRTPHRGLRDESILLVPAIAILTFVSSQTGFSEHMRYVLPVLPFLFVWISQIANAPRVRPRNSRADDNGGKATSSSTGKTGCGGRVGSRWPKRVVLAAGLLFWSIGSSLWVFPHSLSYFNELVGGPHGGHAHLLGSNADWGQDLRYLQWWFEQQGRGDSLYLASYGHYDPVHVGLRFSAPPPSPAEPGQMPDLQPGWYAISVNFLRGYPESSPDGRGGSVAYPPSALSYFLALRPAAFAGHSIYIYAVPEAGPSLDDRGHGSDPPRRGDTHHQDA